jgi:predicted aspartyl protease
MIARNDDGTLAVAGSRGEFSRSLEMNLTLACVLTVGSILIDSCATQTPESTPSAAQPSSVPARVDLGLEAHRIPFQLAAGRPIPTLEVRVNGSEPQKLFLDTGASVTLLDLEFARSLGLALTPAEALGDPSGAPGVEAWSARLDRLEIGDVVWRDVPVVATDRRGFDVGQDVRGVLGLPLFADCLVTLDYPKLEIRVEHGSLADSADPNVVEYDASGPLPEVPVTIGTRKIPAHIDSGSPSGFTLPKSLASELGLDGEPRVVGHGRTINGEFDVWSAKLRDPLRLGAHEFPNPDVRLNERFPMTNVGYQVLRDFALTIDQAHRRMRFASDATEHTPRVAASDKPRRLGVMLVPGHDRLTIQEVLAGGAAERAGLKAGDAIQSIGGRAVSELDPEAISAALQSAGEIDLAIDRAGRRIDVVIPAP